MDEECGATAPTHLPHCVWHQISLLIYGLDTAPAAVLAQRAALMLTCREVAAAARGVPLRLDLRGATDVAVVKALLSAAPVSHLWLRPDMGADDVLRAPAVRALSCTSLVELSANISCTDTLQAFPNLRQLHLQAYVLPRLYPAILWNAAGVQHLGLHRFEDYCLTELPPALVPSVKTLDVTPRAVALHSHFTLRLPPGMALRRLVVHGSFDSIHSHKAAPRAVVDVAAMCQQCEEVVIEAEDVIFELGRALAAAGSRAGGVQGFAEALLLGADACHHAPAPAAWRSLEFRMLGGVGLKPGRGQASTGSNAQLAVGAAAARPLGSDEEEEEEGGSASPRLLSPEAFVKELQHALLGAEGGAIRPLSLHRGRCSIFRPAVLRIQRA